MNIEHNKAVARRFVEELLGKGNFALFTELTTPDYVDYSFPPPITLQQGMSGFRASFPDAHFTLEDVFAEGDKVVVRYTVEATHSASFLGIPATGKQVRMTGISIYRFRDGKMVEGWGQNDKFGLVQQIGAVWMPG